MEEKHRVFPISKLQFLDIFLHVLPLANRLVRRGDFLRPNIRSARQERGRRRRSRTSSCAQPRTDREWKSRRFRAGNPLFKDKLALSQKLWTVKLFALSFKFKKGKKMLSYILWWTTGIVFMEHVDLAILFSFCSVLFKHLYNRQNLGKLFCFYPVHQFCWNLTLQLRRSTFCKKNIRHWSFINERNIS